MASAPPPPPDAPCRTRSIESLVCLLGRIVSVEAARRDYGVVLTRDLWELTLAIDHEATARLRADMRAARD